MRPTAPLRYNLMTFLKNVQADARPAEFVRETPPSVKDDVDFMAAKRYLDERRDGSHALEPLNRVTKRFPNDYHVLFERARALGYAGLNQEAFFAFRKLAKAHPTDEMAWHDMAVEA